MDLLYVKNLLKHLTLVFPPIKTANHNFIVKDNKLILTLMGDMRYSFTIEEIDYKKLENDIKW